MKERKDTVDIGILVISGLSNDHRRSFTNIKDNAAESSSTSP